MSLVKFKPLGDDSYDYPDWADAVGWCLGCLSMAQIPFFAIFSIFQQKGSSLKNVSIYITYQTPKHNETSKGSEIEIPSKQKHLLGVSKPSVKYSCTSSTKYILALIKFGAEVP
jgi:hypothetical protein